ncbi:thermonuclease family protein [Jiella marina]|uniref:thermonuclease family protein n=1 Tax=Jiella sp. LLJ827 TaxID=2917712 RepID=UPI002101601B|nr:thermonuclease family protein [Jiella sp. LLJ827]MCQ0989956.1 thermonuclease family protein [Jiella sp. LLJ827]
MDGADTLGEPVTLERIRFTIVTAVGLALLATGLLALVPEHREANDVFEAARQTRDARAQAAASADSLTAAEKDAARLEVERRIAARNVSPDDVTAIGDVPDELVRLPPRAPLSDETLQADTPRPTLLPRPIAIDGGRIAIRQGVITLPGLEVLDLRERCGEEPRSWPCGVRSRTELRRYLRGRSIRCEEVPREFGLRREEITTTCTVGGEDIGQWVVENGWARASPDGPYTQVEAEAQAGRRGIWR